MSDAEGIRDALRRRDTLGALRLYEAALQTPEAAEVRRRYAETMALLARARDIDLAALPHVLAAARGEERRRIRAAMVDRIFELAGDPVALRAIGKRLPRLVLEGTLQQQFCCRLAADLGVRDSIPESVKNKVIVPLIDALRVVLPVGAPRTRDNAVEGLGALLRHFPDPAAAYPPDEMVPVVRERNEEEEDYAERSAVREQYADALRRRRLMVLTVAGDEQAGAAFAMSLIEPIGEILARLREEGRTHAIADALRERSDLLRVLPALARQRGNRALPFEPANVLIEATLVGPEPGDPPELAIAFARYQASIFRTIDIALGRGWEWSRFDEIVAAAVRAIPSTVAGTPAMCNAEIQATIAVLRTAIRLLALNSHSPSSIREALQPIFAGLEREPVPWMNYGIAEECFRDVSVLLGNPIHDDILRAVLHALFHEIKEVSPPDNLVRSHRRLAANRAFRRILLSLVEQLHERQLFDPEVADRDEVHRHVRTLLREPTTDNVWRAYGRPMVAAEPLTRFTVAAPVLAGIAFESDLLRRSASVFARWPDLSSSDRVLATRILGMQLQTVAQDRPGLRRSDVLRHVFTETPGVSLDDTEAMRLTWDLLSSLPAEAAEAAEVEILRFIEYRGERSDPREDASRDDQLPAHVLAMLSPNVSGLIAGTIAREIDLHLRYLRSHDAAADAAKLLYQVMLRGPHRTIFNSLLARVTDRRDRELVMLFRRHVGRIQRAAVSGTEADLHDLVAHIEHLLPDLARSDSRVLRKLLEALELYRRLAVRNSDVWGLITSGTTSRLFGLFDELARITDPLGPRESLLPRHERRLDRIQSEVAHYVALPVGNFAGRTETLAKAVRNAEELAAELEPGSNVAAPDHVLLRTLMRHFRELFDATLDGYCDEPRRHVEEGLGEEFWNLFCDERTPDERLAALSLLNVPAAGAEAARLQRIIRDAPPPYPAQPERFVLFFVEWMIALPDLYLLQRVLHPRWPMWFRALYATLVSGIGGALTILLICSWAAVADFIGLHSLEGLGFFIVAAAVALVSLLLIGRGVFARSSSTKGRRERHTFLLPSLFTATPIALSMGFDHSWDLPLHGSTTVLAFVMLMSYLGARFVAARQDAPPHVGIARVARKRISYVVNLSLVSSFAAAVLLSAIFVSSYDDAEHAQHTQEVSAASGSWPRIMDVPAAFARRFDEVPPGHHHPRFLGYLPREAASTCRHSRRCHRSWRATHVSCSTRRSF